MSILDIQVDREWDKQAACRGMDSELFFPDEELGEEPSDLVKQACASCPVKSDCLADAMSYARRDDWGFFGGTTESDRGILRRARAMRVPFDPEDLNLEAVELDTRRAESKARYRRSREAQVEAKRAWRQRQKEKRGQ